MARNTINFNTAAANLFQGNTKLRIRERDGRIEVRPTARVLADNLPEGETMRAVAFKRSGNRVSGAVLSMNNVGEPGARYDVVRARYGWYVLVPAQHVVPGAASCTVSITL